MIELFSEYQGVDRKRDGMVAAAKVTAETVLKLSDICHGEPVWEKVLGGSRMLVGVEVRGEVARVGDYIISGEYNIFRAYPKDFFETRWTYKGPMPIYR